jgi:hypothetical protein
MKTTLTNRFDARCERLKEGVAQTTASLAHIHRSRASQDAEKMREISREIERLRSQLHAFSILLEPRLARLASADSQHVQQTTEWLTAAPLRPSPPSAASSSAAAQLQAAWRTHAGTIASCPALAGNRFCPVVLQQAFYTGTRLPLATRCSNALDTAPAAGSCDNTSVDNSTGPGPRRSASGAGPGAAHGAAGLAAPGDGKHFLSIL